MRQVVTVLFILCIAVSVFAQDSTPTSATVTLPTSLLQGQILRYNLKLTANGNVRLPGSAELTPLDVTLNALISYTVGKTGADGLTPVTIAADKVSAVYPERTIELTPEFFPQSVALIDKNGDISKIVGGESTSTKIPGINSTNIILLFRSYAPTGELKIGSNWKKVITLAPQPDKYEISYTLQSIDETFGTRTAKIRSDISVVPPAGAEYSAKGYAISDFSLVDGRLVKSHVEMTVKTITQAPETPAGTPEAKPGEMTAMVTWDIQPGTQSGSGEKQVK